MLARSFARIHRQNLINYGILPLLVTDDADLQRLAAGTILRLRGLHRAVKSADELVVEMEREDDVTVLLSLNARERELLIDGGLINAYRMHEAA